VGSSCWLGGQCLSGREGKVRLIEILTEETRYTTSSPICEDEKGYWVSVAAENLRKGTRVHAESVETYKGEPMRMGNKDKEVVYSNENSRCRGQQERVRKDGR
jgi:hypothetical protein